MSVRGRLGLDPSQFRITRGALGLALGELGLSLVFLLSPPDVRHRMVEWLAPTGSTVFEHFRVWTVVTGAFLETGFLNILLHMIVMWSFVPTLERFWGMPRFLRFAAITSTAGLVTGTLVGYALGHDVPIVGLGSFINASIVAFGITYARQPVQFFGALPLTGRQLMYGFIGFLALSVSDAAGSLLPLNCSMSSKVWAASSQAARMTRKADSSTARDRCPVPAGDPWVGSGRRSSSSIGAATTAA